MKLKHRIVLVMVAIYMASVAGLAFNLHFCSGKLSTVSLYAPAEVCKMCAKLAEKNIEDGCCKTELIEVKLSDDHQPSFKTAALKAIHEFILPDWAVSIVINKPIELPSVVYAANVPPRVPPNSLHIINCIFRI